MVREANIRDVNPWWVDAAKIDEDREIQEWNRSELKFVPRLMYKIIEDCEPGNTVVYTLRGLRQVGKTTLIKLQIKKLLEMKIASPWNILYYSLDLHRTPQDVADVVQAYMRITSRLRGNKRCYLFLDEVTSVPDWQKGIKWLIDQNKIKNSIVVATGSQAIDLKGAAERLPGRRGNIDSSYDKILLPMKFSEYVSILNPDIGAFVKHELLSLESRKSIFNKLLNREIDNKVDLVDAYRNELDYLLEEYMSTGGIPLVVNKKASDGLIPEYVYTRYMQGVAGEWNKLGKKEAWLKQISNTIIKSQGSQTSWNGISKDTELGSHNTAQDYVHTLENLFIVSVINAYNSKTKSPMTRRNKKIYFGDPLFLHMFNGQANAKGSFDVGLDYLQDESNKGKILEGIVANHLIRWAFMSSNKKQSFDPHDRIFYWNDDNKKEVDFVYYDGGTVEVPIEVKYRNRVDKKELGGMSSFLRLTKKSGLVISKKHLEIKPECVEIPASVFLLLI